MSHAPIPELVELRQICASLGKHARVETLCELSCRGHRFPIQSITLGTWEDRTTPVFLMVGGVHGLERIGTQIVLAHMRSLAAFLKWDEQIGHLLSKMRLIYVPLVNPTGVFLRRRSNSQGVDLMRNAPVDAQQQEPPWMLFRGHRLSNLLPWYRGADSAAMQPESRALCELVERELFPSRLSLVLDVHSGFAGKDRLWFPYAGTRTFFPDVAEAMALRELLNSTLPHHRYVMEPQALHYTAHGDLWDYLYVRYYQHRRVGELFLPLTLELASSSWLRKNPRQLLSPLGLFHPMKPHRIQRTLRRHSPLLHFLERATLSPERWSELSDERRDALKEQALNLWGDRGLTLSDDTVDAFHATYITGVTD